MYHLSMLHLLSYLFAQYFRWYIKFGIPLIWEDAIFVWNNESERYVSISSIPFPLYTKFKT